MSQGLATLAHICGVILTPQLPLLMETPCQPPMSPKRVPTSSHQMGSVSWCLRVCHDVLLVVHDVLHVYDNVLWSFTSVSWCFTSVLRSLVSWETIGIGACTLQSPHRQRLQGLAIMPQGSAIMPQKWSHAKLHPEWRLGKLCNSKTISKLKCCQQIYRNFWGF